MGYLVLALLIIAAAVSITKLIMYCEMRLSNKRRFGTWKECTVENIECHGTYKRDDFEFRVFSWPSSPRRVIVYTSDKIHPNYNDLTDWHYLETDQPIHHSLSIVINSYESRRMIMGRKERAHQKAKDAFKECES